MNGILQGFNINEKNKNNTGCIHVRTLKNKDCMHRKS